MNQFPDRWADWPADQKDPPLEPTEARLMAVNEIKELGNSFFRAGQFERALRKYKKVPTLSFKSFY